MNWNAVGKVLFFVGLGIFVFNQIQAAVFSGYYGVWADAGMQETIGFKIFDWFHGIGFAINDNVLGWPGLMIAGAALWIGARNSGAS